MVNWYKECNGHANKNKTLFYVIYKSNYYCVKLIWNLWIAHGTVIGKLATEEQQKLLSLAMHNAAIMPEFVRLLAY